MWSRRGGSVEEGGGRECEVSMQSAMEGGGRVPDGKREEWKGRGAGGGRGEEEQGVRRSNV